MNPRPVLAVLAIALVACSRAPAPGSAPAAQPAATDVREVRTAPVQREPWTSTTGATGELAAYEEATVATKVAGRIESVAVDLGSRVERGDPIAAIETRDFELRVAQTEALVAAARARLGIRDDGSDTIDPESTPIVREAAAELEEARRSRERLVDLSKSGIVSQAEFDAADTKLRAAESRHADALEEVANRRAMLAQRRAELALAQQALDDARIVAPFDGAIAQRLADAGEYVAVGAPIARLVRFDPVRVRLSVAEREAASVRIGAPVRVAVEGEPASRDASIVRISPALDPRNRTLLVEGELANPSGALKPGAFVRAEIVLGEEEVVTVPLEALITFAGVDKVIVVEGGKARERRVTSGRRDARRVEIVEGLTAGEEVVLAPGNLQGGAAVRVETK